jgi:hypothetical protein
MLALATATGEVCLSESRGPWRRVAKVAPISKDHHHLPFLPPEERKRIMAARQAARAAAAAR